MAETKAKPVTKGVAKVPVVMQLEALECGAACLTMILAYYGKIVPLEQVRSDCGVSRDGSNAGNIMKAARYYGLEASGYRIEPEYLKDNAEFPCIIHWDFNHFVVLKGFKGKKVYLNDPGRGEVEMGMEEFDRSFTGICLMFKPGESFVPGGKRKSTLNFAVNRIKTAKSALMFMIATGVITTILSVISPIFSRIFVDKLLGGQNSRWVNPFITLLALFNIVQLVMAWINAVYSLRLNGKIAAEGNASYMWKVLHLPMGFFSQRMAGDIQGRKSSNAGIAGTLVNTFAPLAMESVMMVFYLAVMLRYSIMLTAVGLAANLANVFVSRYISKKRINLSRAQFRDSAKLASFTVSGVEMIETVKASGAENAFFSRWAGYQASANAQQAKFTKLNSTVGIVPSVVSSLCGIIVEFLGVYLIMKGEFTVGKVMAFQGFLSSFTAPATTLISAGQTIQEMRTQMERIDDVMEYPDDATLKEQSPDEVEDYGKLSGSIEFRDVSFGYSPLAAPLISGMSFKVNPGDKIAFVGNTGCGKSTITKLISGLYTPRSGEILFDGKPLNEIDKNIFRGSVAVVDQDIILFEDTIANNIKMWDNSIEDFEMILSARDAQIHEDIVKREGGYNAKLNEGGSNLSGGQRQRLEIARVLAQDPTIIIMDEATSALDAQTEFDVVKSINDRGITCIVVAHRLSTIRDCDCIYVIKSGSIIDCGRHEQLMESCEYYRTLVTVE